jgi:hypothetical protein
VTSLANEAAAGSGIFHAVRRQADSDATMDHASLRRTHQQSNCKKKCFLWGLPRGYIMRADGSFELVRRLGVGLHASSLRKEVLGPGEKATGRAVQS